MLFSLHGFLRPESFTLSIVRATSLKAHFEYSHPPVGWIGSEFFLAIPFFELPQSPLDALLAIFFITRDTMCLCPVLHVLGSLLFLKSSKDGQLLKLYLHSTNLHQMTEFLEQCWQLPWGQTRRWQRCLRCLRSKLAVLCKLLMKYGHKRQLLLSWRWRVGRRNQLLMLLCDQGRQTKPMRLQIKHINIEVVVRMASD